MEEMKTILPLLLLAFVGCTRSDAYKQDEQFYEETPTGYYNNGGGGGSATDRLEKLKQPKKKILVLGFWNDTPVGDDSLGWFAADELKRSLLLSKKVIFPEDKTTTAVTK